MDIVLILLFAFLANADSNDLPWKSQQSLDISIKKPKIPVESRPPVVRGTKSVPNCGQSQSCGTLEGDEELSHNYPWVVVLLIDDMYSCTGTIISDKWVLTAAHCMDGASFVEVEMGSSFQEHAVSYEYLCHENWNSFTLANDIALIKMPKPIIFTSDIQPVCLPSYTDAEDDFVGESVITIGTSNPGLCELNATTISNADCESYYGSVAISNTVFCSVVENNHCSCLTSSGGPVNYFVDDVTQIRGITVFGSSAGCEAGYPDGHTRVTAYLGWIETNTGIAIDE